MDKSAEAGAFESIEHQWIPMADGVRLSARVWLPLSWSEMRVPLPAILEYIPYRKRDMVRARDERNHPYFASNGFVCLRVDMRGSGDSEGHFSDMYSEAELDDARQVVDWIASQPWCNGAIGMMGTSWGGTASLQAAAAASSRLRAIIAVCATNNRYEDDIHHMGGCLLTDTIEWGATLPAIIAMPGAPEVNPDGWRERWRQRLDELEFPLEHWIRHETRDAYWRRGSVCETPDAIDCPTLAIGGWADRYSNTVMNLLEDMPQRCWGIVGPWGHHYPDAGHPQQAIGFQQEALRWWNRWLKDEKNGICAEPRLRAWCGEFQAPGEGQELRRGRWIAESRWPGGNIETLLPSLHPASESTAAEASGYARVPDDLTVGIDAGDTGYFGRPDGFPREQSEEDRKSLVFESAALDDDVEILGRAELTLDLVCENELANMAVRICDVDPDGVVARVSYAIRNLALNENFEKRDQPITGGQSRETVVLPNLAYRFRKGHRIRVSISSSYWPMIWPAPEIPRLSVRVDSVNLALPRRVETSQDSIQLPAPMVEQEAAREKSATRPGLERQVFVDAENCVVRHRWHQPISLTRHDAAGLAVGSETFAEHYLCWLEPTSARSSFSHRLVVSFDGVSEIEVVGEASLSASSGYFYPAGSVRVYEDGSEVFHRDWSFEIERKSS